MAVLKPGFVFCRFLELAVPGRDAAAAAGEGAGVAHPGLARLSARLQGLCWKQQQEFVL